MNLTVPKDGSLPVGGLLPAFSEWPAGPHPSTNMADSGITLKSVRLNHPEPAALTALLKSLDAAHLAAVTEAEASALSFILQKADGEIVTLRLYPLAMSMTHCKSASTTERPSFCPPL